MMEKKLKMLCGFTIPYQVHDNLSPVQRTKVKVIEIRFLWHPMMPTKDIPFSTVDNYLLASDTL